MSSKRCRACHAKLRLRFDTDGAGGLLEVAVPCPCGRGWRTAAGVCLDCDRPVEGARGKALRCSEHKRAARQVQCRRFHDEHRDERNAVGRARLRNQPGVRSRKAEQRNAWKARNPERAKLHKRRDAIRNSERYQEYYRRYNAAHAEKRRAYCKKYCVYRDTAPACSSCSAAIPFDGRGRPMQKCASCDPVRWEQRERRRALAVA